MLCIARVPGAVPAISSTLSPVPGLRTVQGVARHLEYTSGEMGFTVQSLTGCRSIGYRHASGSKKFYFL
jgi:hypothetical protein